MFSVLMGSVLMSLAGTSEAGVGGVLARTGSVLSWTVMVCMGCSVVLDDGMGV